MPIPVTDFIYQLQEKASVDGATRLSEIGTINDLLDLAVLARTHGLLALNDDAESFRESDRFLWFLLRSVVDGVDPEVWMDLALTQMSLDTVHPARLFHDLVCFWGVLEIQRGTPPGFIATRMKVLIGDLTVPLGQQSTRTDRWMEAHERKAEPTVGELAAPVQQDSEEEFPLSDFHRIFGLTDEELEDL